MTIKSTLFTAFILMALSTCVYANTLGIAEARIEIHPPENSTPVEADNNAHVLMILVNSHPSAPLHLLTAHHPDIETFRLMHQEKEVKKIAIAANGTLSLSKEGFYLKPEGINTPLSLGKTIPLTLGFDDGNYYLVNAIVAKPNSHIHHDDHGNAVVHDDHNNE